MCLKLWRILCIGFALELLDCHLQNYISERSGWQGWRREMEGHVWSCKFHSLNNIKWCDNCFLWMPFSFTTWIILYLIYFCLACVGETTLCFQSCSEEDRVWQDTGCLQAEAGMWLQSVSFETAASNNVQVVDCSVLVIVTDFDWKWCWMVYFQDDDDEAEAEESDKSKSEINDDDEDEDVCVRTNWREFLFLCWPVDCWLLLGFPIEAGSG